MQYSKSFLWPQILLSALQYFVLIVVDYINRNEVDNLKLRPLVIIWCWGREVLMEHFVLVTGDTADIETAHLLIIKRCV